MDLIAACESLYKYEILDKIGQDIAKLQKRKMYSASMSIGMRGIVKWFDPYMLDDMTMVEQS